MRPSCFFSALFLVVVLVAGLASQPMPLVYNVENTCADCPPPPLPPIDSLASISFLPDPLQWADSTSRLTKYTEWSHRRAEISAQMQHYLLGQKPGPPDSLIAVLSNDTLIVTVSVNGQTLVLHAKITLPASGSGPFPAVIGMGQGTGSLPSDIFTTRNIATIAYNFSELALWGAGRGDGGFYTLFPDPKVGNFTAWAWGLSRIIDGLYKVPQANIDLEHLAVTGCSFAGKMALYSSALDERIALTIAQEPGGGGDATWRFSQTIGPSVEILSNAQGNAWYYEDVKDFNNAVTKLPFDQHEVMALIAPRALLVLGNPDYVWLADESGHVGCLAAQYVWIALRANDRFGFSKVGGHLHCSLPDGQRPEVIAFVEKFLLGNTTTNTSVTTSPWGTDIVPWVPWPIVRLTNDLTSVGKSQGQDIQFRLRQNYPNPFNPTTTIQYALPHRSHVTVSVFNALGQEVSRLVNGEVEAGAYEVTYDPGDLPTGVYYCRLQAGEYADTKKLMLVR